MNPLAGLRFRWGPLEGKSKFPASPTDDSRGKLGGTGRIPQDFFRTPLGIRSLAGLGSRVLLGSVGLLFFDLTLQVEHLRPVHGRSVLGLEGQGMSGGSGPGKFPQRGCFQKRSLVQDRGGRSLETGGIVGYFEDFKASPTKILGQGTFCKQPYHCLGCEYASQPALLSVPCN